MTVYTEIFGGNTLYPAEPDFLSLTYSTNQTLVWPIEQTVGGDDIVAKIIELHPSTTGLSVAMPNATLMSTGYATQFYNAEASTTTITDAGGNTLLTVASGTSWTLYLRDNTTANGTWRSYQAGAGTSTANAASLAGAGLKAITTTLNTKMDPVSQAVDYVIVNADRATVQVWTGGSGTFTLPNPATVGEDWYVMIKNAGSGSVTLTPPSGTIDGSGSLIFAVDESAFVYTDGTNFFTVGYGQQSNAVFDFISINVAGTGNYTLSGAELNRIAYEFTGILTGNRNIIVPASVQQYWCDNQTSGAFTLTVKTLAGTGVTIPQGSRTILYCDGTDVVNAETVNTNIPSVVQGDTLYASAPGILAALAKNTTATRYLSNTGTDNNPAWAQINLANGVTGALPSANGGTGFASGLVFANKSATTSRNSTTTSTADPALTMSLAAGTYQVDTLVQFGGVAAGGFRFQMLQSGGVATGTVAYVGNVNGATVTAAATGLNTDNTFAALSGGNAENLRIATRVDVSSTTTLSFAWAQNSSNVTNTSVFVGYMVATRIA
jgi:hypothetical protein